MESRFNRWVSCSMDVVEKERRRNLEAQELSPPLWIFQKREFVNWLEQDGVNTLWLSGTTGYGKSVLAACVIDEIQRKFPCALVSFFFCKNTNLLGQAHHIMKTLLQQIIAKSPTAYALVKRIWQSTGSDAVPETVSDVTEFFTTKVAKALAIVVGEMKTIFFVVDGVEACPKYSIEGVLTILKLLQNFPGVRILVTCQRTPEIMTALDHDGVMQLELHGGDNEDNIIQYVKLQLQANPSLKTRFDYIKVDPIDYFRRTHNGLFLWVSTVLSYLHDVDSDEDFESVLFEVPDTMAGIYQATLKRLERELNNNEKLWVKEILNWVVVAVRDLNVNELEVAATLTDQIRRRKKKKAKLWNIEKTLSRCGSVLRVTALSPNKGHKTVSVVHDSFRLFVTDRDQCQSEFLIEASDANTVISRACLSYLMRERIRRQDGSPSPDTRARFKDKYPLFSYATLYWSTHLLAVTYTANNPQTAESCQVLVQAVFNFCTPAHILNWATSVITYSDQSVYWFKDIHLTQFATIILAALQWVANNRVSGWYPGGHPESDSVLLSRAARGVASTWVHGDPTRKEGAFAAFTILEQLLVHDSQYDGSVVAALNWADVGNALTDPEWLANIGHAHMLHFREQGELRLAIDCYCMTLMFTDDVDVAGSVLAELYRCLAWSHYQEGSIDILDDAIEAARQGVNIIPHEHIEWPSLAKSLAVSLQYRFTLTQCTKELDESIAIMKKVLAQTSEEDVDFAEYADILAAGFSYRSQAGNNSRDIDASIEMWTKSVHRRDDNDPQLIACTFFLAFGLMARVNKRQCFDMLGISQDLDDGIKWMKKSLSLMPNRHPGFTEAMEALQFMVTVRTHAKQRSGQVHPRDFSDREELARLYLRTDAFHPKIHTFHAYAFWWLGNYDAALRAFETALRLSSSQDQPSSVEGLVHEIRCDECMTIPMRGFRHRCKTCFDHNICHTCRVRREHDINHEFISIPRSWARDTNQFRPSSGLSATIIPYSNLGVAY